MEDHIEEILKNIGAEAVPDDVPNIAQETSNSFSRSLEHFQQPRHHTLLEHIMKSRMSKLIAAAVVIMAYWFAYLHTPGGLDAVVSTVMIGTLYAIPTSYLWLGRGLETAMGFHFWLDFVKFAAAYLLNQGLWFR